VPAVVRRFEEHGLSELVVATAARDPDVSDAAAAPGSLPGQLAEARCPAHLCIARPQMVTEQPGNRLVFEQGSRHLSDHALTACHESMIFVTCMEDRCQEPSPRHVTAETGASLLLASVVRQAVTWVDVAQITMQFLR
jgi:hypothetical protein